jgi:flagellar hook-associated protein 1 FlgK
VRLKANDPSQSQNTLSIQEAYAQMVADVGQKTANNEINLESAKAMHDQSEQWMQSVSGVSLDEEASNLVRYQQAYAASARILSTAQSLFDSILAAAR